MQFRDLRRQYNFLHKEIDEAIKSVALSSAFIAGPQVGELEQQLAAYVGVKHCISCANGTDALTIALKIWDIGPGDAVFVPDFTFFASAEVISEEGATPVFYDVDKDTFNADAQSLEQAIERTMAEKKLSPKAIIVVDLFGLSANYPEIQRIKEKYGLYLLEDGAQGFGGSINGKMNCSFGDISTTSFFPSKPLGCYGDGGAIFTDNNQWAELARSLCVHGRGISKYENVRVGLNSRLDTLQAAILSVKLKAFQNFELDAVNKAAQQYTANLSTSLFAGKGIHLPVVPDGYRSSWAQYTIRLNKQKDRDTLKAYLAEHGIPSMIYYPLPLHKQTVYKALQYDNDICPNTRQLCGTVLSLPMHPYITEEEIELVCKTIKECL